MATDDIDCVSETFIRTHLDELPFPIRTLLGCSPRMHFAEGRSREAGLGHRAFSRIIRSVSPGDIRTARDKDLARLLRRHQIAVVLAEYGVKGVQLMRACRRAQVPLIVHFHGYDAFRTALLAKRAKAYQEMFQIAHGIVAVSRAMRRQLIDLGAPAEKVSWIPYWVDTTVFDCAVPSSVPPVLLAVGRFVEKKAPIVTLTAFARIAQTSPDATLVMLGDGPLLPACKHFVKVNGLSERVHLLGAQPHNVVCEWMKRARAFVQHSVRAEDGDSEGTPVAILEAQASGLPVVATRHMGIEDVVVDGVTGYLVDELDAEAMAKRMATLIAEPKRADEMGRRGREQIERNYSRFETIDKLATLIREAAAARVADTRDLA